MKARTLSRNRKLARKRGLRAVRSGSGSAGRLNLEPLEPRLLLTTDVPWGSSMLPDTSAPQPLMLASVYVGVAGDRSYADEAAGRDYGAVFGPLMPERSSPEGAAITLQPTETKSVPARDTDSVIARDLGADDMALDRIIVTFSDPEALVASKLAQAPWMNQVIATLPVINGALMRVENGGSVQAIWNAVVEWSSRPGVTYAQPDFRGQILSTFPNDSDFSNLWGMHNTGQTGGTSDADIDAPEAWDLFTGTSTVVVAGIDTGIDYTHQDLVDNMWTNDGEVPDNFIDDDGNGVVDDVYGFNAVNNSGDPMDDHGHGTHTAGTFGGVGNNSIGVAGVVWDVEIMALKWIASNGNGFTSDAIECIDYMTDMKVNHGVNIVASNNSWRVSSYDQALYDAIAASNAAGIVFVAAAGNYSSDNDVTPVYPASFDLPGIISVAATDHNDLKADFSNWGATTVDLGAPGVNTYSTLPGNSYGYASGTSMASPHVAGAVAFIKGLDPSLTVAEVKEIILGNVDPIPALAGITVTGGRLNLAQIALDIGLRVVDSEPAAGDALGSPITDFVVHFSDPYNPATVDASDLTVAGIPATSVTLTDADTLTFHFDSSPMAVEGQYTMAMAADTVERLSDGLPLRAWESRFWYDVLPMEVVSTVPANGSLVALPLTSLQILLNEPVDSSTIGVDDLIVSRGQVIGATQINATTIEYALTGISTDAESTFSFEVPYHALADQYGNPSLAYAGNFTLDVTTSPFPTPLSSVEPAGSLIYRGATVGSVGWDGDVDTYTIALDAGQTVTLIVDPDASLRPQVELVDPSSNLIGVVTASEVGKDAVLQTVWADVAGTYSIRIAGAANTSGLYNVQLILNSAVSLEVHDGADNGSMGVAQDLTGSFVPLASGLARRGAVIDDVGHSGAGDLQESEPNNSILSADDLMSSFSELGGSQYLSRAFGTISAGSDGDWDYFRVVAGPGDALDIELRGAESGNGTLGDTILRLYDVAGNLLAENDDYFGLESFIQFVDFAYTGDYFIVADSFGDETGTYTLFTKLTTTNNPPVAGNEDWYRFQLTDGEFASLAFVSASADGNAAIELRDGAGTLLAIGGQSAELNQAINRYRDATTNGTPDTYFVRVVTSRSYSLIVTLGSDFDLEQNDTFSTAQYATSVLGAIEVAVSGGTSVLNDFPGMNSHDTLTGLEPPDTHAAVGPAHVVEVVNTAIAMYNKDGSVARGAEEFTAFFDPNIVADDQFLFDPVVAFDEMADRWVLGVLSALTASAAETDLLYAVSDTSDPTGGWSEQHRIDFHDVSPNLFADYPKVGFNADAHVFTFNMFGGSYSNVDILSIDKDSVLDADPGTFTRYISQRPGSSFTMAAATMHGSLPGGPMWFVEEAGYANGGAIRAVLMDNVLSTTPTYSDYVLAVDSYDYPPSAVQPGGIFNTNDTRILNAEWRDDRLVATHAVGMSGEATVRWYEMDTSGGVASLVQQGMVDGGVGVHTYFPSIAINAAGDIGLTFMQSSSTEYVSMYVAGQVVGSLPGVMGAPTLVAAGNQTYGGGRGGDYSGITVDPVTDTFWAANEISLDGPAPDPLWSTWIGEFSAEPVFDTDLIRFAVNAGDSLQVRTFTPFDGIMLIENTLDPAIELYDPTGNLVAWDSGSASDGVNALLDYSATVGGEYRVRITSEMDGLGGEYFVRVDGATGADPVPVVVDVDPNDGQTVALFPSSYVMHFSEPLLLTSLLPGQLIVNGVPAAGVTVVDANSLAFDISGSAGSDGLYTVHLLPGAVADLQGNENAEAFFSFVLDTTGPTITATSWNGAAFPTNRVFAEGPLTISATMSELLLTRRSARTGLKSPGVGDLMLFDSRTGTTVPPTSVSFDVNSLTFVASFPTLLEGQYTLVLLSGDGAFEDMVGNDLDGEPLGGNADGTLTGNGVAGGNYSIDFSVDRDLKTADPFARLAPQGSLVARSDNPGLINFTDDEDAFDLLVSAGEVLSAIVQPLEAVTMTVELVGVTEVFTASAPGEPVVLPATLLPNGGTYEIRVSGSAVTEYVVRIVRNAIVEQQVGGDTGVGNELAIDNSHVSLGSGRFAVVGASLPAAGAAYSANMDTNPGWILQGGAGAWEYGTPQGLGGDPSAGHTGTQVIGYDLGLGGNDGLYSDFMSAQYAITPSFDASAFSTLELSFSRWLGVESADFDHASVQVSTNGFNWTTVWDHTSGTFQETAWSRQVIDLTDFAAGQPYVYLRWSMGPTDSSVTFGGWNIDDVLVTGTIGPDVDLYELDLTGTTGEMIDVVLAGLEGVDFAGQTLELLGTDGTTVLATAAPDFSGVDIKNYDLGILDFVVPADGVYTLRLTSTLTGDYTLVVTDGMTFDTESNNSASDPLRGLNETHEALGYLGSATALFATRTAFNAAVPGLPVEDFEEGQVAPNSVVTTAGPIMNGVVNNAFGNPNDILPGIIIQSTDEGHPAEEIALLGAGLIGNASKVLGANWFLDNTEILFPDGVGAVGMDVLLDTAGSLGIDVYGLGGQILYSGSLNSSPQGAFFGMTSADPIARIVLLSSGGDLVDNIAFGAVSGADRYDLTLAAGQPIILMTDTPLDDPGLSPQNLLDPALLIYSPSDVLVAQDSHSAPDGKNAQLVYTAGVSGVYNISVTSDFESGEYVLSVYSGLLPVTLLPADGSANALPATNLVMTFAGNMQKGAGDFVIRKLSDHSIVETIPVTSAAVTISGGVVTVDPTVTLEANTGYYVEISKGTLLDSWGMPYMGKTGSDAWNFQTAGATIAGRQVFYNNSTFDGNDAGANASDDGAIGTDKQALIAGQLASTANYTSFSRGINGIMVDVAGLANPAGLSAADFEFRVGNSADPTSWSLLALDPTDIVVAVRPDAGVAGSDRVTILFPDGAIQNTWLQVTVKANATTGLGAPDVHYWGHALGETGDVIGDTLVDNYDVAGVLANPHTAGDPAAITDPYDFNRDQLVDAVDAALAQTYATTPTTMLRMLDLRTADLPEITISVSPGAVTEDGAANLVYTFTRSGSTAAAATIGFRVTGSAVVADDYTVSGATSYDAKVGTVTFAAASSTATVTIDPTADTKVELDETAWLSVLPGTNNKTGAPSQVSGTITSDDTLQVTQTVIQEGTNQRSIITYMKVTFNADVAIAPGAFQIINRGTGQALNFAVTTAVVDGKTTATLAFLAGNSVYGRQTEFALNDGNYQLTIDATKVTYLGLQLDGNRNGTAGDNFVFGAVAADKFFRYFGDMDGDRDVDATDYGRLGLTYRKIVGQTGFNKFFDYDGDGDVDATDYGRFSLRYRKILTF